MTSADMADDTFEEYNFWLKRDANFTKSTFTKNAQVNVSQLANVL